METRFLLFIAIIFSLFSTSSCTTTGKVTYFQNTNDSISSRFLGMEDAKIQYNDILSVIISSRSKEASMDYNKQDALASKGYTVTSNGNILLPSLGYIQAVGLTKKQLSDNIVNLINSKKLLLDPIVEIHLLNFEVTVLGEVSHPLVINVANEQISLVKALGMAGDITIYGKRHNILLIREEDGIRTTRRIDISSSKFLQSEYYYLKPNDVIYVEPNKAKVALSGRSQQILPIVITSVSFLFLVLDKVIK
ncbi:polysaccharide biosynthesis/export family protein [Ferruginibacter sp.]